MQGFDDRGTGLSISDVGYGVRGTGHRSAGRICNVLPDEPTGSVGDLYNIDVPDSCVHHEHNCVANNAHSTWRNGGATVNVDMEVSSFKL